MCIAVSHCIGVHHPYVAQHCSSSGHWYFWIFGHCMFHLYFSTLLISVTRDNVGSEPIWRTQTPWRQWSNNCWLEWFSFNMMTTRDFFLCNTSLTIIVAWPNYVYRCKSLHWSRSSLCGITLLVIWTLYFWTSWHCMFHLYFLTLLISVTRDNVGSESIRRTQTPWRQCSNNSTWMSKRWVRCTY